MGKSIETFARLLSERRMDPNPFVLHLVVLYSQIEARSKTVMQYFQTSTLENHLLNGTLLTMGLLQQFQDHLQDLHEVSRALVILEYFNDRHSTTISKQLRDMDRLEKETAKLAPEFQIDVEGHERIRDGFFCLQDFCDHRARQIRNRKERLSGVTALVSSINNDGDSIELTNEAVVQLDSKSRQHDEPQNRRAKYDNCRRDSYR